MESLNSFSSNFSSSSSQFSSWDNDILKLWPGLRIPPFHHTANKVKVNRKEVRWRTLTFPLVKLNFDGASRGNLGSIGLGCIVYSDNGVFLTKCTKPLGIMSNNLAELEALIEGLILSREMGIIH